ncbi:unnamed protein product [Ixodes persulcatus]
MGEPTAPISLDRDRGTAMCFADLSSANWASSGPKVKSSFMSAVSSPCPHKLGYFINPKCAKKKKPGQSKATSSESYHLGLGLNLKLVEGCILSLEVFVLKNDCAHWLARV